MRPLLAHPDVRRWVTGPIPQRRRILYPHVRGEDGKRRPIRLSDYPRAAAYLKTHEGRLKKGHYVIASGRQWYEIWVPHNPDDWRKPKIVFPDISEHPRFALDRSGSLRWTCGVTPGSRKARYVSDSLL